jgi:hypothetical protein
MRSRSLRASLRFAGFDNDHRLLSGGNLEGFNQPFSFFNALDIDKDDFCIVVLNQIGQQIGFIHVALVADGNNGGKAQVGDGCFRNHGDSQRAALRQDGDMPRTNLCCGERRVQRRGTGVQAEHIRPHDTRSRLRRDIKYLFLLMDISDF